MAELRPITEENFLEAFRLKLAPGQEAYVSHPIRSLAQAYVYRDQCQPFGIYAEEKMVGYVMVIYDYDVPEYDIWHMMIDASMQGRGYGGEALDRVLDYIRTKPFGPSDRVALTCSKGNPIAKKVYESKGFAATGNEDEDEIELALTLAPSDPGMKLIRPSMEYDQAIQAYRQEFLDTGESMDGGGSLRKFDRTQDWLDRVEAFERVETMPKPWVPTSQYIFIREADRKMVGVLQIRHYFNEYLEKYGGHIGYSVAPSERRKGYATQMLRLALPECARLGIDRVLITCVRGNEGSRRTILNNGGVFESAVYDPEDDCWLERYWIDLSAFRAADR